MSNELATIPEEALREMLQLVEAQKNLTLRDKAQHEFLPFVHHVYDGFIEGRHHRIIAEKLEKIARGELKRLIVNMPPRHALDIKEKILTTDGWKTIETLRPGDFVYGPDGLPTEVLGKSEVFDDRELFVVTTDDGCEVTCDGDHIWTVRLDRKNSKYVDYTTEQLFARENGSLVRRKRSGDVEIRHGAVPVEKVRAARLPDSPVLKLPKASLPVDPYVLGVWLGDGASLQATFTASDEDAAFIRAEFERRGYVTKNRTTPQTFGVDGLKVVLRDELGVVGSKHIPEKYLLSSFDQRMDLLRGLMDSDGNVSQKGQCFFTQKCPELIHSVRKLLWSLGIKNTLQSWEAKNNGVSYGTAYRVSFYAKDCCLLPRKLSRTISSSAGRFVRVKKTGERGPTQCIRVAREDGLFLVGEGLVITHNSKSEFASYLMPAWFLGRNPKLKIIQATHNTELAVRFGRKVRDLINDPHYQHIFPETKLKEDSKSAGRWETQQKGEYFAAGVGSAVTGRGADLFIIDDPHALEITTPIPTPKGFVEIQHLKVGDEVFGPDGMPTKVVGKSEVWHDRDLYSVLTSDGEEVLCDGGHLWSVNSDTCLQKARLENYTTRYLAEWPLKNRPIIPRHQPVVYPEAELPIDPWVLGAWLGDGTSSCGRITAHPDDQPYMIEQFRAAGYEVGGFTACGTTFTVYGLHSQLRELGVLNNKHVPEQYLTASVEQRMALLQGLVDTDGSVIKSGQCGFYNCNVKLVDAVVEILHSLGVKATRRTYYDKRGRYKTTQPNHRVMFRLENAARMPRKRMYTRTPVDKRSRSITVEPTKARGSVQCITVDRPDGLFLAGRGYVVTHNSEQDALSETAFDNAYEWYTSGPRQRLQPGGAIILVMCMTGDTPVLMASGTEKPLRDIRPGDTVATYEDGRLSTATINNWQSSGVDSVFKILTQSGRILRANEGHPFLVSEGGAVKWVKLRDLKPGMQLVSLRDATDHLGQKQNPASVKLAKAERPITEKTRTLLAGRSDIMESGLALNVQTLVVQARRLQKVYADLVTRSSTQKEKHLKLPERTALNFAMESLLSNTRRWFSNEIIDAMSVATSPQAKTLAPTGTASFVSTIATTRKKSADSCAMTVTSPSGMEKPPRIYEQQQPTSSFTTDEVLSIEADGEEEVFDVEVDRTENFIANGVVSHNTRWGKKDLTGRLLQAQSGDPMADQWEVVELPAILPSDEPLWPEFWNRENLLQIKASLPVAKWSAQWQQQPTASESAIVKREWWRDWDKEEVPNLKYIMQAYDTAFSTKESADYSAITTWGIFTPEEGGPDHIILLDAQRGRWNFPELKEQAADECDYWDPDMVIIEAKASGQPLADEMRRSNIPVVTFSPGKGKDKVMRMHTVAPLFEAGMVWAPLSKKFADEVIEEVSSFPAGDHDDFCDSMTLALMRFRQGGFIYLDGEEDDDLDQFKRKREYY